MGYLPQSIGTCDFNLPAHAQGNQGTRKSERNSEVCNEKWQQDTEITFQS
jgi:hypothetical protein